ncbi:MAG: CBS domain-containing protein, partial [Bradyrhizobium sp.]
MTVRSILSAKGSDVVTIEPHVKLATAAKQLAERKIGALVVTGADRRVIGILSERDIVLTLAADGATALDRPLSEVMTRTVTTCSQGDT